MRPAEARGGQSQLASARCHAVADRARSTITHAAPTELREERFVGSASDELKSREVKVTCVLTAPKAWSECECPCFCSSAAFLLQVWSAPRNWYDCQRPLQGSLDPLEVCGERDCYYSSYYDHSTCYDSEWPQDKIWNDCYVRTSGFGQQLIRQRWWRRRRRRREMEWITSFAVPKRALQYLGGMEFEIQICIKTELEIFSLSLSIWLTWGFSAI